MDIYKLHNIYRLVFKSRYFHPNKTLFCQIVEKKYLLTLSVLKVVSMTSIRSEEKSTSFRPEDDPPSRLRAEGRSISWAVDEGFNYFHALLLSSLTLGLFEPSVKEISIGKVAPIPTPTLQSMLGYPLNNSANHFS